MDFAAAGEEGWEEREGDVRVKALWVHPIKVSNSGDRLSVIRDEAE